MSAGSRSATPKSEALDAGTERRLTNIERGAAMVFGIDTPMPDPDEPSLTAELLVTEAGSDMLFRGQTLWSMQSFYTTIVTGLLGVAFAIAGLSGGSLPVEIRGAAVASVAALASAFAAVGRYSVSYESFYFVRARAVRNSLLKELTTIGKSTELQLHCEVLDLPSRKLSEFRVGKQNENTETKLLRQAYVDSLTDLTLTKNGVRHAMQMTLLILGLSAGAVASGAAALTLWSTSVYLAAVAGLVGVAVTCVSQSTVLGGLKRELRCPPGST
jgi:hypothetical protein